MAAHQKNARDERAHLVLIDESGFLMAPTVRRTQAPRGKTPVLKQKGRHREKVSVVAALSLAPRRRRLGLYFRTRPRGYFDSGGIASFLRQLLRHLRGRVIVVWDRGNMHRGEPIRELLRAYPRLTLEPLPSYAPDLNPVEQVWSHLKYGRLANFAPVDADQLDVVLSDHLASAGADPRRLRSFYAGSKLPFPERVLQT